MLRRSPISLGICNKKRNVKGMNHSYAHMARAKGGLKNVLKRNNKPTEKKMKNQNVRFKKPKTVELLLILMIPKHSCYDY